MVIRGRIRGNGRQLADYLMALKDNDRVELMDIYGTSQTSDLRKSLIEMSLTSELSRRTGKGLYHVVINPRPEESRRMQKEDWLRAVEIVEKETGFTGQKRVMVLHEKDNRIHLHVAWERYHHEKHKMIPNKGSRWAQDRARIQMEKEFSHLRTPMANEERPLLRQLLADMWQMHPTGKDFIKSLSDHGYTVAKSDDRRPYTIINAAGLAFDLVREMKEANTKQVRERLRDIRLPDKKTVIKKIRTGQALPKETERDRLVRELKEQMKQREQKKDKERGR